MAEASPSRGEEVYGDFVAVMAGFLRTDGGSKMAAA
jgi:hypothetical protein